MAPPHKRSSSSKAKKTQGDEAASAQPERDVEGEAEQEPEAGSGTNDVGGRGADTDADADVDTNEADAAAAGVQEEDPTTILSPQGAVPTRTRSARKKRKLQEEEEEEETGQQCTEAAEAATEGGDAVPLPAAKRARRSAPAAAAAAAGTGEAGASDNSNKDGDAATAAVQSLEFDESEIQLEVLEDSKLPAAASAASAAPMDVEEAVESSVAETPAGAVPAAAAVPHGAAVVPGAPEPATAAPAPVLPRIEALRLPAHRTPGKRPPEPLPPHPEAAFPVPRREADRLEAVPPPRGRGLKLGLNFGGFVPSAEATAPAPTKPPPEGALSAADDAPSTMPVTAVEPAATGIVAAAASLRRKVWVEDQRLRTLVWFVLIGILQLPFYPIILSAVERSSDHLLHFYQGLPVIGRRWAAREAPTELSADQQQILDNLQQDVSQAYAELRDAVALYRAEREMLAERLRDADRHWQGQAERWNRAMRAARAYPLDDEASERSPQAVAALDIATLQELLSSSHVGGGEESGDEEAILDVSFLASWNWPKISDVACPATTLDDPALDDPAHQEQVHAALQAKAQELRILASESARQIQANASMEKLYRQWIETTLLGLRSTDKDGDEEEEDDADAPTLGGEYQVLLLRKQQASKPHRNKVKKTRGASSEAIHELIAARMEVERADQTGRTDYASILNGAAVLRHSRSLRDRLPLWNRLAQLWSWRSYGLGPEAAITPIHPPFRLGHCWAFAKDPASKNSAYGALTLRLAGPVVLQSVSIEHPPPEITDRRGSAIRQFRVVGFEDADALAVPWPLGSFEYQLDGAIRQEFRLLDRVRGEDVPAFRSLALWIDSNWGEDYSCLYRVRAFGKEESSKQQL